MKNKIKKQNEKGGKSILSKSHMIKLKGGSLLRWQKF